MTTEHPKRIGAYDVLGKIGKGGMGSVYKAVQPSLNRIVAIKVLADEFGDDETSLERFKREAKAVALVNHPNVVQIIEMDEADGDPYFVMEYVPGTSLDAVMQRRRLSLTEALGVFKEVCKGLQAAHRQNIVHRDLNPRNVLVSEDLSVVKLADFGISRVEAISRAEGTLSTGNIAMGTLHYMAPEQSTGIEDVDHRADIYALGVLLYEMLTGRVPVGRFSLPSQLEEAVPPEVDPLVLRCLSAEPGDRYPTVERVLEAVTKLEDQLRLSFAQDFKGLSRSTSRLFSRSTTNLKRRPTLLVAALVAVAVLGALSFVLARSPAETAVASAPPGEALLVEPAERFRGAASTPPGPGADIVPAEVPIPELGSSSPPPAPESEAPADRGSSVGGSAADDPAPATRPAAPAASPTAAPAGSALLEAAQRKADAGLTEQALADFDELIAAVDPVTAPAALLARARLEQKLGRDEDAMASLIELNARYPKAEVAAEGQFQLGMLFRDQGKSRFREALAAFTVVIDSYPGSAWVPASLAHRANLEEELKMTAQDSVLSRRVPAALLSLRTLLDRFPTDPAAEGAAWNLAELYRDLDLHAKAAETYVRLGESFPSTTRDAWWEAGELFEEKVKDPAAAIAAYRQVPASSRNYAKAQRRLKKLSS